MPKLSRKGPLNTLTKEDVASLTTAGWLIKPPTLGDNKTATEEAISVVGEINILTDRLNHLMIKQGAKAENEE